MVSEVMEQLLYLGFFFLATLLSSYSTPTSDPIVVTVSRRLDTVKFVLGVEICHVSQTLSDQKSGNEGPCEVLCPFPTIPFPNVVSLSLLTFGFCS